MVDRKQARLLLDMAKKDLGALEGMADRNVFADEIFGFHVQQAAEKGLKAWIALCGMEIPRSHILSALLDILEGEGEAVDGYWNLLEYQVFAVQFRYEALSTQIEPIDRKTAVEAIQMLLQQVDQRMT
jgi:HEPN domain-containing protein